MHHLEEHVVPHSHYQRGKRAKGHVGYFKAPGLQVTYLSFAHTSLAKLSHLAKQLQGRLGYVVFPRRRMV